MRYIALLRAVNVGGTGKLPMVELKKMCEACGFTGVATYIASGNVVFDSTKDAVAVQSLLEKKLAAYAGKPVGVIIRTQAELVRIMKENPFTDTPGNYTCVIFLPGKTPKGACDDVTGKTNEQLAAGKSEIYAYFPTGQGTSKLKIKAAKDGTGRNVNTVQALIKLAGV